MAPDFRSAAFDETVLSAWRQVLVDSAKRVTVGGDHYPVRRTAKHKLAQVDFQFEGTPVRGLEQNPQTKSRWAQLARKGSKVMQRTLRCRRLRWQNYPLRRQAERTRLNRPRRLASQDLIE
jgi:hypothetical protein